MCPDCCCRCQRGGSSIGGLEYYIQAETVLEAVDARRVVGKKERGVEASEDGIGSRFPGEGRARQGDEWARCGYERAAFCVSVLGWRTCIFGGA